jgi:hypothetical protein
VLRTLTAGAISGSERFTQLLDIRVGAEQVGEPDHGQPPPAHHDPKLRRHLRHDIDTQFAMPAALDVG